MALMFWMIVELANMINSQDRNIVRLDVPENALSSTRYKKEYVSLYKSVQ
jgi:hypothetical protein